MPHWILTLAYDGTSFHGWQIQPNLPTIQGTLAQALHHLTGETVLPQGSGRTDTGVHALAQVCSFSLTADIPPANLLRALNRALPASIRILSAAHAPPDFHARHSARRKTYQYHLFPLREVAGCPMITKPQAELSWGCSLEAAPDQICPPFLAPHVWDCPWPLSLPLLNAAATQILGTHDFQSFAATDPEKRSGHSIHERPTTKTILASTWHPEPPLLIYTITGTGFLHHMVRNLVGTFVDIARGATLPPIPEILAARNRTAAGPTAPARGLFLQSVDYQ